MTTNAVFHGEGTTAQAAQQLSSPSSSFNRVLTKIALPIISVMLKDKSEAAPHWLPWFGSKCLQEYLIYVLQTKKKKKRDPLPWNLISFEWIVQQDNNIVIFQTAFKVLSSKLVSELQGPARANPDASSTLFAGLFKDAGSLINPKWFP